MKCRRISFILILLASLFVAIVSGCSSQAVESKTATPNPPTVPPSPTSEPPTEIPSTMTSSPTPEVIELNPSPRGYVSMAYDTESKQVILFGGQTGIWSVETSQNDETWAYDVIANVWKNMKPDSAPSGGSAGSLVYDSESDRIIMYGKTGTSSPSVITWVYDYNSNTWTRMKAKGPANHLGLKMAYDIESDRVILFGGFNLSNNEFYNDTWAYDLNSDSWIEMEPANSPSGRNFHAMTYDSKTDRVILWGGDTGLERDSSIWAYDYNSNTWEQRKATVEPRGRDYAAIDYDSLSDQILLYGGNSVGSDETWVYSYALNTWTRLEPDVNPGVLSRHTLVYIPDTDHFILFGGQIGSDAYVYSQKTWIYDLNSNTWTETTRSP